MICRRSFFPFLHLDFDCLRSECQGQIFVSCKSERFDFRIMRNFLIILLSLTVICFVSLLLTFGYDEGTMRLESVGVFAEHIFLIFKYPFNFHPSGIPFFLVLALSTLLYSLVLFSGVLVINRFYLSKIKNRNV